MDTTLNTVELQDILNGATQPVAQPSIPSNLLKKRENAFASFREIGLPKVKDEEFKYTNFGKVLKNNFSFQPSSKVAESEISDFFIKDTEAFRLVFINGRLSEELSDIAGSESALEVSDINTVPSEEIDKYYAQAGSDQADGFTLLNNALSENGVFIKVKRNKVVSRPVVLYYITDTKQGNAFVQPHNIIVGEENAEASFVQSFHSIGSDKSFNNIVTEAYLKESANIQLYTIQNDREESYQVNRCFAHQLGKSRFYASTITLNGSMIRNDLNILMKAEHSESELYGLYLLKDNAHADNHTLVDHAVPNCYSNELYKGILDNKSTGVFNGKIYVRLDAQKTNAFQSNKSILLSKDATMNTKPQLEIFADDVKCTHGATIGQLDEEPLFYLRSRGIKEETAKKLLVLAFAQDIVNNIRNVQLKHILTDLITKRIS
ncbi:Fe-S cluster assembly protein SufD [Cytophagaceae bacterium ABcell3]|nr:Fe-S cluster assembly protein SufD [Cytophagaceae bacterium ABcell3]